MSNEELKKLKDELEIKRNKFISLAIIGGAFAILVTLLQVDLKNIKIEEGKDNLLYGISIFCFVLPILIVDAFRLNLEETKGVDGKPETTFQKVFRFTIWTISGAGFVSILNYLPNKTCFATGNIILVSFFAILILRVFPFVNKRLKKRILTKEKKTQLEEMYQKFEDDRQ